MIQARSIYRHKHTGDYVVTDTPNCDFVDIRTLTRDLNVPGGFVLEPHMAVQPQRVPIKRLLKDWQFIKELT
jgi:hypothetical protein